MARLAAVVVLVFVASCSGPARSVRERPLGDVSAQGWRFEAKAIRSYSHRPGGLLAHDRDEWTVSVELRAKKADTDAKLGLAWFAFAHDPPADVDRWFAAVALDRCTDGERVLLRVRPDDALSPVPDPRWHLFVASPSAVAVETRAVSGDECRAALASAPSADAWLAARLARPLEQFQDPRLGGAVLGQEPFPKRRLQMTLEQASALLLAAREGRRTGEAIDFALDRLPANGELVRWTAGSDAYGPYDVLATERARLLEAVRRDPAVGAHVRARSAPASGNEHVARWLAELRAAAGPGP